MNFINLCLQIKLQKLGIESFSQILVKKLQLNFLEYTLISLFYDFA